MTRVIPVRTSHVGPTDSRGSAIIVRWGNRSKTVPFDYSAADPHESAVRSVFPGKGCVLTLDGTRNNGDRKAWSLQLPELPGDLVAAAPLPAGLHAYTRYAHDVTGEPFAVTLLAPDADTAAKRFAAVFDATTRDGEYQYWAPDGFPALGVQA